MAKPPQAAWRTAQWRGITTTEATELSSGNSHQSTSPSTTSSARRRLGFTLFLSNFKFERIYFLACFRTMIWKCNSFHCEISEHFENRGDFMWRWYFPWKIMNFPIFHQKLWFFNFGIWITNTVKQLQNNSDILKMKLLKCENVWRHLAEFLKSEQCKSV